MRKSDPIGVFDSGLGGISVLKEIHALMPEEDLIFIGDSAHNPYGTKSKEEIVERCIAICDFLNEKHVKAIVVACNTATSAAIPILRERYDFDIIGMEPALKVACDRKENQTIAVWATDFTLKEKKFANLMERFNKEHEIVKVPAPKLVRIVEEDKLEDETTVKEALTSYFEKSCPEKLDSIVLGCTHFVFYRPMLENLVNEHIQIVDGNNGTARHLKELLAKRNLLNDKGGKVEWFNTDESKLDLSKKLFEHGMERKKD